MTMIVFSTASVDKCGKPRAFPRTGTQRLLLLENFKRLSTAALSERNRPFLLTGRKKTQSHEYEIPQIHNAYYDYIFYK